MLIVLFPSQEMQKEREKKKRNKPDKATMRPDCVFACIDFGARHIRRDRWTDRWVDRPIVRQTNKRGSPNILHDF